jgi:isoleucyl-tRNA synthetase
MAEKENSSSAASEAQSSKSETAKREEEILAFWREHRIFEKSLERPSPKGEFVFYDGPPFATGLPHYGSLLSSIIKDVIPRYKTMRGFHVRRRWGWDCHGLPIENLVEKKLGLKTKKDIEALGIDKFNEAARAMVLQYAEDWEKYVDRIGRWVDFKNSYKTMDNTYIESVWWALAELHKKGQLYEGRKVLLYCPHCETPLAKAEIAMDNSYQEITEEAVTVKFEVTNPEKLGLVRKSDTPVFMLAWTTTPWTLPGNVAIAVGKDIQYVTLEHSMPATVGSVTPGAYVIAQDIVWKALNSGDNILSSEVKTLLYNYCGDNDTLLKDLVQYASDQEGFFDKYGIERKKGRSFAGLKYKPLYPIEKVNAANKQSAHSVLMGDFVTTDEGTGIVHTAVIYGEDDYNLGLREDLPMVPLLDSSGKYNSDAPEFLQGRYIKEAEADIKVDLKVRNLLLGNPKMNTHSYPHCYRCGTPLIYNALSSWFVNIQQVKDRMIALNEDINWFPEHLKHGRFGNIVESAPDWTISRNRFWASPLPIWKSADGEVRVIGSLDEIKKLTKKSGNQYIVMRHGEAENNVAGIISTRAENPHHLTEHGREQVHATIEKLRDKGIDLTIASPFVRTQETARLVAEGIGLAKDQIITREELAEFNGGDYDGKTVDEYHAYFANDEEYFTKACPGGETYADIKCRVGTLLYELEETYTNKTILVVTHEAPAWLLAAVSCGLTPKEANELWGAETLFLETAAFRELPFVPLPHNADYELDLHRPYIDTIELVDEQGRALKRIPEVVDCWVESGSMPFAEYHYPFEHKDDFERRFPGDFISEYIAQTRTWFYYMHAMAVSLFDTIAFRSVVTTGTILAADGSKMSKSKGNYTDPLENLDRYGADALRYYLMTSVVMQAEDLNFRNEDIREAHNRVINMLWNSYQFYQLYARESLSAPGESVPDHVLDQWLFARQKQLIRDCTGSMDAFDTVRAGRALRDFIDDLSTWYIRRSRDRFRSGESGVMSTLRATLETIVKIAAPLMPFITESIYRGVRGEEVSVHLADWPTGESLSIAEEKLIADMTEVRRFVSLALEARAKAGIKVRQPLQSMTLKTASGQLSTDLLQLIKDEVNVKEVVFNEAIGESVELDTTITLELKEEGWVRELVRNLQDVRKAHGLTPQDTIEWQFAADAESQAKIERAKERILADTRAKELEFAAFSDDMAELAVDGEVVFVRLAPL